MTDQPYQPPAVDNGQHARHINESGREVLSTPRGPDQMTAYDEGGMTMADENIAGNGEDARPAFTVSRYVARRAARGAPAVEVKVTWPDGVVDYMWMSRRDVRANIIEWGGCDGLNAAFACYRAEGRDDG